MAFGYDIGRPVAVCFADPTKDNVYHLMKVPSQLAKIEILEAWAVTDTTVTLGNGTGIALRLLNYGTGGAAAVGTLTASLGGTTVTWTANTPKAFTMSDGTMTAGQYLVVSYDEEGGIAPLNVTVGFNFVSGVSA